MSQYAVTYEEAVQRLDVIPDYDSGNGEGPHVHTFAQSAIGMLGAHWALGSVEELFKAQTVEEAGAQAKEMNHGLVVTWEHDGRLRTVFFATKPEGAQADAP